jgi:hypothetical protein
MLSWTPRSSLREEEEEEEAAAAAAADDDDAEAVPAVSSCRTCAASFRAGALAVGRSWRPRCGDRVVDKGKGVLGEESEGERGVWDEGVGGRG